MLKIDRKTYKSFIDKNKNQYDEFRKKCEIIDKINDKELMECLYALIGTVATALFKGDNPNGLHIELGHTTQIAVAYLDYEKTGKKLAIRIAYCENEDVYAEFMRLNFDKNRNRKGIAKG
tara:strand:- start:18 stop:377 length:360 start_codon:yes stop_codon:yes gene_type:complete